MRIIEPTIRCSRYSLGLVLAVAVGTSACLSLTDVDAADVVEPDDLRSPEGATVLWAGAVASFYTAFAVGETSQIVTSGLIADEFFSGHPLSGAAVSDLRGPATGPYQPLQRARIDLLEAVKALQEFAPSPPSRIGHLLALLGYTKVFLGEAMCSGIPLGTIENDVPVHGTPVTTGQIFESAVADFDGALTHAGGDPTVTNLARVGQGRAFLNLARYDAAANAVAAVPADFVYSSEHSAAVQPNGYFEAGNRGAVVVPDREGGNGLDFRSANDPRVPTRPHDKAIDGVTDNYLFTRYDSPAAGVVLASGIVARLTQAEAAYQANPDDASPVGSGWLGILNDLRATQISPALPPLDDPGTRPARVDLLFRERAFWLFATGHRHGDLRRLVRQYGRDPENVFPTGFNRPGLPYGSEVVFQPDPSARLNPNFQDCADRDA